MRLFAAAHSKWLDHPPPATRHLARGTGPSPATKQQTTHNFPIEVFVAHETHDASSSKAPLACEQASSKVGEIPLAALYALADFPCLLFTFCQIGFYLPPMTQVVGDDSVDIGQRRGGIAFRDGFRGRPVLESANHQLQ